MKFFTSDTHFWHYNIIDFCSRPVAGYKAMSRDEANEAMNRLLVERWNEKIGPTDEVYHLGDFFWCGYPKARAILDQLNGVKHWIRGNHDHPNDELKDQFVWVRDYYELKFVDKYIAEDETEVEYKQHIVLFHFPILSWHNMQHGTIHLHGHTHASIDSTWNKTGLRMDVGVDTNNLYPYSWEDIKNKLALRTVVPVDYHSPNRG